MDYRKWQVYPFYQYILILHRRKCASCRNTECPMAYLKLLLCARELRLSVASRGELDKFVYDEGGYLSDLTEENTIKFS